MWFDGVWRGLRDEEGFGDGVEEGGLDLARPFWCVAQVAIEASLAFILIFLRVK